MPVVIAPYEFIEFGDLQIGEAFTIADPLHPGTYIKLPTQQKPRYGWVNALGPVRYHGDAGYRFFYNDFQVLKDRPDQLPELPVPQWPAPYIAHLIRNAERFGALKECNMQCATCEGVEHCPDRAPEFDLPDREDWECPPHQDCRRCSRYTVCPL